MSGITLHIINKREEKYFNSDDIAFVKADGNYCDFYFKNGAVDTAVRVKIGYVILKFNQQGTYLDHHLVKVGRSYILNVDCVKAVDRKTNTVTVWTTKVHKLRVSDSGLDKLSMVMADVDRYKIFGEEYGVIHKLLKDPYLVNDNIVKIYGHEYVDLGLPSGTLWALTNVDGPVIGNAWISPFTDYNDIDYLWDDYLAQNDIDEEESQEDDVLNAEDVYKSVASKWDSHWHKPSREQWNELLFETSMIPYQYKGTSYGLLIKGYNSNFLNLPLKGGLNEVTRYHVGEHRIGQPDEFLCFTNQINGMGVEYVKEHRIQRGYVKLVVDAPRK